MRESQQQLEKSAASTSAATVDADTQLKQSELQMKVVSIQRSFIVTENNWLADSEQEHADAESQRSHPKYSTISQIDRLIITARREGELLATLQFRNVMASEQRRNLYDSPCARKEMAMCDDGGQLPSAPQQQNSSVTIWNQFNHPENVKLCADSYWERNLINQVKQC